MFALPIILPGVYIYVANCLSITFEEKHNIYQMDENIIYLQKQFKEQFYLAMCHMFVIKTSTVSIYLSKLPVH